MTKEEWIEKALDEVVRAGRESRENFWRESGTEPTEQRLAAGLQYDEILRDVSRNMAEFYYNIYRGEENDG